MRIGGNNRLILRRQCEEADIRESEVVETSIIPTRQVEGERGKSMSKAPATGVLPLSDTRRDNDEGKGRFKMKKKLLNRLQVCESQRIEEEGLLMVKG